MLNLQLYSLLSFASPDIFSLDAVDEFVERYTGVDESTGERFNNDDDDDDDSHIININVK